MHQIEQAIFTADDPHSTTGYRIVAQSSGLLEIDARELVVWCPAHDALHDSETESINFHPLPSGSYCISRTTAAGWDYGNHGGERCFTHCLIVPPTVLARFANNPFALLQEAKAKHIFDVVNLSSASINSISLSGGATSIDSNLLAELGVTPGAKAMAAMVYLARNAVSLAIAGDASHGKVIQGLLNCLPIECRPEFSFSTGLKFSPRRCFHLIDLSEDPAEQAWVANHPNVTVFDLNSQPQHGMAIDGWSQLIEQVFSTHHIFFFAAQLSKRRFSLSLEDLPALGLQLLEEIDAYKQNPMEGSQEEPQAQAPQEREYEGSSSSSPDFPRAHAAHQRFDKSLESAMATKSAIKSPSSCLNPNSPAILEQLEYLDDVVYEAINGQSLAMRQLKTVWPKLFTELGDELLAESREQYLHYAMSLWEESANVNGIRNPTRAAYALDVLCILFGDGNP
jgi:hypothetical protein